MELLQLLWEDQNRLIFKFKKNEEDNEKFLPENIKSLNIKYELSKKEERAPYIIQEPFLISIKKFHFSTNIITFFVQLGALSELNKLQINIIRLTIFYYSGDREEIFINKIFQLSEISYNDGEVIEITEEELVYETKTRYSLKKRSLNKTNSQTPKQNKILKNNSIKTKNISTIKNLSKINTKNMTISISFSEYKEWLNLKKDKSWDTTFFMVREGYKKLSQLEKEIKILNSTMRKIALKNTNNPSTPIYLQASPNMMQLPSHLNLLKDTIPSRNNNKYSLSDGNNQKVFRNEKDPKILSGQIQLMKEMKEKFNSVNNVKELLSKIPDKEIKKERARTDHLAFLEFKQKNIERERDRLIDNLKNLGCKDKIKNYPLEKLREKLKVIKLKNK
ncbi:MAG: hypothetical protein KGD57_07735 [Candidatus Lokiarchaeota archaeon]|nr:hypothetical protein [Candidatus Lokiarchaeota archaeon]